jgi:hypothetical protein
MRLMLNLILGAALGISAAYVVEEFDYVLWKIDKNRVFAYIQDDINIGEKAISVEQHDIIVNCMADSFIEIAQKAECPYTIFADISDNMERCIEQLGPREREFAASVSQCVRKAVRSSVDEVEDQVKRI